MPKKQQCVTSPRAEQIGPSPFYLASPEAHPTKDVELSAHLKTHGGIVTWLYPSEIVLWRNRVSHGPFKSLKALYDYAEKKGF